MNVEKYIGESILSDKPRKKLSLVIKDGSVTNEKLADGSITMEKLGDDLVNIAKLSSYHVSQFKAVDSTAKLPKTPNDIAWIVNNHLYLYTGEEDNLYTDCGAIRGAQGVQGAKGDTGANGKSAYEIWESQSGNTGKDLQSFLNSMKGTKGEKGDKGDKGDKFSFSDLTSSELQQLKGEKGDKGEKGSNGLGIASITQPLISDKDSGINMIVITRSDGEVFSFEVRNGSKGSTGDKGETGEQGEKGDKGDKGDKGETGDTGEQGIQGEKGDKGDKGDQGIQGEKGDTGEKGETGAQGAQGLIGPQGASGVTDASNKTLVNDVITGGETDFLSAEMGKLGVMTYDVTQGGKKFFSSLQDAINSVPETFHKGGLTIMWVESNTTEFQRYTLTTRDWSTKLEDWKVSAVGLAQDEGDSTSVAVSQKAFTEQMKLKVDTSAVEDTISEEEGKIPSSKAVKDALGNYLPLTGGTISSDTGVVIEGEHGNTYLHSYMVQSPEGSFGGIQINQKGIALPRTDGSLIGLDDGSDKEVFNTNYGTIKVGEAGGLASLDDDGNVPLEQMSNISAKVDEIGEYTVNGEKISTNPVFEIPTLVNMTEAEYNGLDEKDEDTYYMLTEE